MLKNTLPSLSTVSRITSASGNSAVLMEEGVTTATGSSGLNLVASIKKVSSRNATSHIAVMSMFVLFLGIFILGISTPFLVHLIRCNPSAIPQYNLRKLFVIRCEALCQGETRFVDRISD